MIGVPASGLGKRCALVLPLLFWTALSTAAGPGRPPPWTATVSLPSHQQTEFDDSGIGLEIDRIAAAIEFTRPLGSGLLSLGFRQENSAYRSDAGFFAGDDRADVTEIGLTASYRWQTAGWSWLAGVELIDSVAQRAEFGDGGYAKAGFGALRPLGDSLVLGLMITGRSGIEADPSFMLLPLVEYTIDERNRIGLVRSAEPTFGYTHLLDDAVEIYLAAVIDTRQFRIDDGQAAVDRERGLRVGGIWRRARGPTAEAYIGFVDREIEFDGDRSAQGGSGLDRSAFFGLAASFRF